LTFINLIKKFKVGIGIGYLELIAHFLELVQIVLGIELVQIALGIGLVQIVLELFELELVHNPLQVGRFVHNLLINLWKIL
jgi:hypothetical protein